MEFPGEPNSERIAILVVEDSATQAEQLKHHLEEHGYLVTVAGNGKDALATLSTCHPAAVISDIVMPEMDGYTLCQKIKANENLRDIPVLLLTSLSGPEDVVRGLKCGADNFIRKPYDQKYLLSRIEYVLANCALRKKETLQMGVEIYLNGERHFITAERQQMLDLLVSTYEEATRINTELQQREKELGHSLRMLKGLHRLAETLNACRVSQEVWDKALERALELPGIQAGWISLCEAGGNFRLAAARGLPPALEAPGTWEGDCLCRRKLLAGELDQGTNILECERLQKAPGDTQGLRYHASISLWNGNRVVGVLNLAGPGQRLFDDEELKTLHGVANQMAVAMERARLLEELERKVDERTAALTAEVAEHKLTEKALRESEMRYRSLFENAAHGIFQVGVDGTLIDVNPALFRMLGYASKEELLVLNLGADIYHNPEERRSVVEQVQQKGYLEGVELQWKRKDGTPILVRTAGRAVYDEQGRLQHLEGIAEDVTEHRVLEKQNRQLQKFEAIGQLAGGIAHDFNNVIGVILGWAEMGAEETTADSPAHGRFQKIREQAARAASLTRQLLAFARRQILETRNLNLNESVQDVVGLLEKTIGEHIQVKTVLGSNLWLTRADPTQAEQVLMNLCLNARDAMPRGGQLIIETRNIAIDEAYCRLHRYARPGRYVQLAVSDTGIGMDEETIEHIFEPFFTTKETGKGTGLGLAMVYGIVKQHGGFVHVYSEPGHGSTFRAYFPLSTGPADASEEEKHKPVRGGKETILVAEDHDGGREIAREILEKLGYTVLLAANGEEALRLFESHRDRIALVLLDVIMPRLSGPDAYNQMCAIRPGVPALFLTGYSAELDRMESLMNNGAEILGKPYSPSDLGRKVREILDRAHSNLG